MKKSLIVLLALIVLFGAIFAVFFAGKGGSDDQSLMVKELNGAGASFPYPLYATMFDNYYKEYGVMVNYQSIGSSGGITNIKNKIVDFGASDAYLSDKDMASFAGEVIHIPTCVGAIVITYNLNINEMIKLDGDTAAEIFLGEIKKWNDPAIAKLNPSIKLPDMDIIVVHRSDGSGTTHNFTTYLAKVSKTWADKVGAGKAVNWPAGLGGEKNAGVANLVKQTPGAIGYVELAYAKQNGLAYASIRNKAGNYIVPSLESASKAADFDLPSDLRVELVDSAAKEGYPISTFTWLIIYKEQNYDNRTIAQAQALLRLIWWMTHEGQKFASPLDYSPLSPDALKKVEAVLYSVTYDGKPVMTK